MVLNDGVNRKIQLQVNILDEAALVELLIHSSTKVDDFV